MAWKRENFNPDEVYDFLCELETAVANYARVREIGNTAIEYEKKLYAQQRVKIVEMESMLVQVGAAWRVADDYIYAISNLIRREKEGVSKLEFARLRHIVEKEKLRLVSVLIGEKENENDGRQ